MIRKAYLEITNICNLACSFCPGTTREKRYMTVEEFSVLASKLRSVTQFIYFHLMGEPLLHPDLNELFKRAEGLDFKVIITTNGTLLSQKGSLLLNSPSVHKVNISLQAFEANQGLIFEDYVNQCACFAKAMEKAEKLCVLRLWNQGGQDMLNEKIMQSLQSVFPLPWRDCRGSRQLGKGIWLEPGEKFDWPDMELEEIGEKGFCYGLRDQIGVLCDGTVVPCCLDHNGDLALGNLFHSDLNEIMSTELARTIYDGFSNRRVEAPLCRRCGYAKRFT